MVSTTRIEHDSLGPVEVPADKYWGAQTQRAINNFPIGGEILPHPLIKALAIVKYCGAKTNVALGCLDANIGQAIADTAKEIINGKHIEQFPLMIWQSGSGTQSNMNINEVLANLVNEKLGDSIDKERRVHPNDHCNLGQSSNDTFPTAMHIALLSQLHELLIPALSELQQTLSEKSDSWADIIKVGRTHLQDATPLTLGQEFSAYSEQLRLNQEGINRHLPRLYGLAQGGTAVGTGLNSTAGFDSHFAGEVASLTGLPFYPAENKFEAQAAHDAIVEFSGSLNTLAVSLNKISADVRLLASGPRCGLGELSLPANEPGSSIMPGKINPSQCEALSMVCAQVFGNHITITFAGAQGNFELNAFKPVIAFNILQSVQLLGEAIHSFNKRCARGIEANTKRITELVETSLMLITSLTPTLGYDKAAEIALKAHKNSTSLREEAINSAYVTEEEYDNLVDPGKMI